MRSWNMGIWLRGRWDFLGKVLVNVSLIGVALDVTKFEVFKMFREFYDFVKVSDEKCQLTFEKLFHSFLCGLKALKPSKFNLTFSPNFL